MNRRAFLSAFSAAIALDPERALWVPRQKLISIPVPYQSFSGRVLYDGAILTFRSGQYRVRVCPNGRRDLLSIGTGHILEFGKAYLIS